MPEKCKWLEQAACCRAQLNEDVCPAGAEQLMLPCEAGQSLDCSVCAAGAYADALPGASHGGLLPTTQPMAITAS